MSNYVTKTIDLEQRAKLSCVRELIDICKEVNGKAYANAFHAGLPEVAEKLKEIADTYWELYFELSDLLVYEKVEE